MVRVCSYSENEDEEICDDTYGESGEFNINAVVRMLSPVQANTYTPGDFIPITWQSYFVSGNKVNIKIKYQSNVVWSKDAVDDTGAYTFYVPPDMKAGLYTIEVVGMQPTPAPCADSPSYADPWGLTCASWAAPAAAGLSSCKASKVTACGSHAPVVITTAAVVAVPAVVAVVGVTAVAVVAAVNASAAVAAVAAVTTGGNPYATIANPGLGAAGFAVTAQGNFPSPGIHGMACTVDDIYTQNHYWGSGGVMGATAGTR